MKIIITALISLVSIVTLAQASTLPSDSTYSVSLTSSVGRDGEKVSLRILSGPLAGGYANGYINLDSVAIVKITDITLSNGEKLNIPTCKYFSTFNGDEEADRVQVDQSEWTGILHGGSLHAGSTLHIRLVGPVTIQ